MDASVNSFWTIHFDLGTWVPFILAELIFDKGKYLCYTNSTS